jgi:hypothetical protein
MTDHPAIAAGCTQAQIDAFERIAVGDTGGHHPRVLVVLGAKGLIDFIPRESSDVLGRIRWLEPFVPLHLHAQWCAWCDENVSDEEVGL